MSPPDPVAMATELPVDIPGADIDSEARQVIKDCLVVARERLGMEIGWLAEFRGDRKIFRIVDGATDEWGLHDDDWLPLTQSYCRRMFEGRIPNAISDTSAEPEVVSLDVTESLRIGSYIGVPLVLPDGELRGAFCCARHSGHPELDDRDVRFMQVLARLVGDQLAFRMTLREIRRFERESSSIRALLAALEARDNYTGEHSQAVVQLAGAVARRLELDESARQNLERVALLHDIGKVGIPDSILRKAEPLTEDEWVTMRRHPTIGAELIAAIPELAHLATAVEAEHERWDGTGYPRGLAGEAIPVESRITFVCDGYHAMISDRPYRRALNHNQAIDELRRCSGTMFWPDAVTALLQEIGAPFP
jgi:putative nucleotidyltransferase with HDIG domain